MSLFDDLLSNKPSTGQTGSWQTSTQPADPLTTTTNPIIISETKPMIADWAMIQPETTVSTVAPPTPLHVESMENVIPTPPSAPPIVVTPPLPEDIPQTPVIVPEHVTTTPIVSQNSPLFDTNNTTEPVVPNTPISTIPESPTSSIFETTTNPTVIASIPEKKEAIFHDTNSYLDHAIEEVSELITGIDAVDAMTLSDETEHRKQKEYFAKLEIADEVLHQKHLQERAHAENMKKYLEMEKKSEKQPAKSSEQKQKPKKMITKS